jgi:alpha-beta hydrolase superfamily lysophospholipase
MRGSYGGATLRPVVLRRASLIAAVALLLSAASASAASPQQLTVPMSDGVRLACSLVEPDGTPPSEGWPALMLFHGLGGTHQDLESIATQYAAPAGYATLECDARGHGASQGLFGLDGPRDVQDTKELFAWLAARPEISDTQIGALGISLGGGAVWNATVAGVPFKAIVPAVTWTNLTSALAPQGLSKSGLVQYLAGLVPPARWDPALLAAQPSLVSSADLSSLTALAAPRSPASRLGAITTPTLLIQGRHDFLFDIDQALAAFRALKGPKRLYLGDLGHAPAGNPPAEQPAYARLALMWFDHFLKGTANGVDKPLVDLAHDPYDGKTATYSTLPPTKIASVLLPGSTTISGATGKVVRGVRITGGPHETFGDSTVVVRYSGAQNWDRLVAVLALGGNSTPITAGGAKLTAAAGTVTIRLMNEAVRFAAGQKLIVYLSSTSLAQNPSDALYLGAVQPQSQITIERVTLNLSVLKQAVSR